MKPLGVYQVPRLRGLPRLALAQAEDAAPERVAASADEHADTDGAALGPNLLDFLGVVAVVVVVVAGIWLAARWARRGPTRGLRAAVRKAKRLNERMVGESSPHPAPEMAARRRVEEADFAEPTHPAASRVSRGRTRSTSNAMDARAQEAMGRLARILSDPDGKDIVGDYVRLDTLVRRWLFDRYGVPAFSVSAATLLNSLPQELTEGVVDDAGEVLRVCEVAQLSAHRTSRRELRHLCGLAYELISNDGASSDDPYREAH